MKRIIAIANQKGGVGKTTTAINLSAALANFHHRVLLIDMDPQGNASRGLGFDITMLSHTIYHCLMEDYDINRAIKKTIVKNLDLLPANIQLAMMDIEKIKQDNPYELLKAKISEIRKKYDYILIDCPPSFGWISMNALSAATSVLIPVQCEYFAMSAVSQILSVLSSIQAKSNPDLEIEGFLLTMYDPRKRMDMEISTEIRGLFKENTFYTSIPRNVSIPESNQKGMPVTLYHPSSTGSISYLNLAKELLDKHSNQAH